MNSKLFAMIYANVMTMREELRNDKAEFYKIFEASNILLKDNTIDIFDWYGYVLATMVARLAVKMEDMANAGVDPMNSSLTPEIVGDFRAIERMYNEVEEKWNAAVTSAIEVLINN